MTDEVSNVTLIQHDGKFARHESAGVDLAIRGLAASIPDDHELPERGMAIFDGLHTVLKKSP